MEAPLIQQMSEITPLQILTLDQFNLPVALPPFQLLLAVDGFVRAIIGFRVNKPMHAIGFDKRGTLATAMLRQPLPQGIRDPDVERAVASASENIDVLHRRRPAKGDLCITYHPWRRASGRAAYSL